MEADCLDRMNNRAIRVNSRRYRTIRTCFIKLQIYFSYLFALFSISIIVFGLILFFKSYNNFWLLLPLNGLIFILIGALIYTNAVLKLNENEHSLFKNKSKRYKRSARESHIFESHLSINMLPQCFTSLDVINRPNRNTLTQRYLMLPIDPFHDFNQNQRELNEQTETIVQLNNVADNDQSWTIDPNNELEQQSRRQLNVDEGNIAAMTNNNNNNNNNNNQNNDNENDAIPRNSIVSATMERSAQDDFDIINPNVNEAPPSYEEVIDVTQPINVIYPTL